MGQKMPTLKDLINPEHLLLAIDTSLQTRMKLPAASQESALRTIRLLSGN
jgi:hypothetical protein